MMWWVAGGGEVGRGEVRVCSPFSSTEASYIAHVRASVCVEKCKCKCRLLHPYLARHLLQTTTTNALGSLLANTQLTETLALALTIAAPPASPSSSSSLELRQTPT